MSATVRNINSLCAAWKKYTNWNGIYRISDPALNADKEQLYLKARRQEGRIYEDKLVQRLPLIMRNDPYFGEWEVRLIAAMQLHKYLLEKKEQLKVLDIGCGNGWMANLMSQVYESRVIGIDINWVELEQAVRLFGENPLLQFAYCDIETDLLPEWNFNVILLAATIQYFPCLRPLIDLLLTYLNPGGEIHIIDSPFYQPAEINPAKRRTQAYYTALQYPGMAKYYNHHSTESLKGLNFRYFYNPGTLLNKVRRKILFSSDSPFPWIVIYNQ